MNTKLFQTFVSSLLLISSALSAASVTGLDCNGHLISTISAENDDFTYARLNGGIQFRTNGITKNIIFYGPRTVRVNANLGVNYWSAPSLVVISQPCPVDFNLSETSNTLLLKSAELILEINKRTGAVSFFDSMGNLYTQERKDIPQSIRPHKDPQSQTYEVENTFTLKKDEALYGFGFLAENESNRRGKELLLIQTNMGIVIPVMMSSENYGILWDTYSVMKFKDDAQGATLWAENAPGGVDYYFMAGDCLDDVVADYRRLTGKAPMYPKQAFGLFMSKERYKDQQRLVEVAETFRKEQFPLDYIVQDWQYWGSDQDGTWSGMIWNPERYPDAEAMTRRIHDLNMKLMISIWPSVGNDTELAKELDTYGLRFKPLHWISKKARVYDAFSKKGREIYFKYIKEGLLDKGVDALWMDGTEVEVTTACWGAEEVARDIKSLGMNAMGDFSRYLNPYSLMTTQGTYDGQRATGNKRVFTLTRSAWAGAQRTAAASWSGDIYANWNSFQQQVADGINVTVTGNPYWTQDSGGFFVSEFPGGEANPAYRELFARWFQFSAFNPIMRIHGTSIEREPYIFIEMDPPVYASLLDTVHLRYQLLPYIYSLSWQVTQNDYTLMRPLVMDFSEDKAVFQINDAFMFGGSLLIHPVTRPMFHLSNPPAATIPSPHLITTDGKPGLSGQYFSGENFEKPMDKTVDLTIDHTWPGPPLADPPGSLDGCYNFSAKWQGYLIAEEEGTYEIGLEGDDGFRLFLNGELVVDDWNYGGKRYRFAQRAFQKGEKIPVKIEFFQGGNERCLRLAWRTPRDLEQLKQASADLDLRISTYLPKGTDWYDFWNNTFYIGGQSVETEPPLNIIPLYVRAGSILPMGPVLQYATEQPDAPYEIRVYPGADASFTLYEDDNETYNYEKGEYATYDLVWDDSSKTLSIGPRQGRFPGLIKERTLNIILIEPGAPGGLKTHSPREVSILYDGSPQIIRFE